MTTHPATTLPLPQWRPKRCTHASHHYCRRSPIASHSVFAATQSAHPPRRCNPQSATSISQHFQFILLLLSHGRSRCRLRSCRRRLRLLGRGEAQPRPGAHRHVRRPDGAREMFGPTQVRERGRHQAARHHGGSVGVRDGHRHACVGRL